MARAPKASEPFSDQAQTDEQQPKIDASPKALALEATLGRVALLKFQLSMLHVFIARLAMRFGLKVLRYHLPEGERSGVHTGPCWLLTVDLPERAGQVAFAFSDGDAGLLEGIAKSGPNPVNLKDVASEDFERLVRAMLACSPGSVPVADLNPWNGTDGSASSHEKLLASL